MRNISFLFGWLMFVLLLVSCSDEALDLDQAKLDDKKSKLQNREFVSESLIPNYIGNSEYRQMQIYTPPGYDKHATERYPVVYLLHGLPFSEKTFIMPKLWDPWVGPPMPFVGGPDFPAEGFREWVDGLIEDEIIEPMIIVMPNAANNMYGFSLYTNSVLNGGFEDYIVHDLVDYVDSHYRTIPSKDKRALIGTSQGGYAAVKFGMKYPEKFGVVASHSGFIFTELLFYSVDIIKLENPNGLQGPDPTKFMTSALYAMASAWSPDLTNPPYFVQIPLDDEWNVIQEIKDKWLAEDAFTMLDNPQYFLNMTELNGVYLDAGNQDELNMKVMSDAFASKLNALNNLSPGPKVDFVYENFEGGHFNKFFSRFRLSLEFCSDRMD